MDAPATSRPTAPPLDSPLSVLMVYPWCLDHVGHGNIQRALALGRYLAARGLTVDLVYQGNPRVSVVPANYASFRRVHRVEGGSWSHDDEQTAERAAAFFGPLEPPPPNLQPSAGLTRLARALLETESYAAVLSTYAWTAPIFDRLARPVLKVLDVQDVIHQHARDCAQATGSSTPFALPRATEEFLWRQWDLLLAITAEDEARIRPELLPSQRTLAVGHATTAIADAPSAGRDDLALYAASDNPSNQSALAWLLDEVWPLVRRDRPDAVLAIAGLICRALPASVERMPGVRLLGFRDDLAEDVRESGVVLAPYLYGSGLKIKVVESASAGKAMVTTPSGLVGTGLEPGRSVEVHSTPAGFASAVAGLLGSRGARARLAAEALRHARETFSQEACYEPVVTQIRLLAPAPVVRPGSVPPGVVGRVRLVVDQVATDRLVAWGNGSHTRALVARLADVGVPTSLIVDRGAAGPGVSAEGLPVVPADGFTPGPADLVVLSSESFEEQMWDDLAPLRDAGARVLGLYDRRRISPALAAAIGPRAVRLGARPASPEPSGRPAVVFWDSSSDPLRWDRAGLLDGLGAAATARGLEVRTAVSASLAWDGTWSGESSRRQSWHPVIQIDPRAELLGDPQRGLGPLTRVSSLVARSSAAPLDAAQVTGSDLLVLSSPTLAECIGLAGALRHRAAGGCPALVLLDPHVDADRGCLGSSAARLSAFYRFALGDLEGLSGGRLAVVASTRHQARRLRRLLGRPAAVVGFPVESRSPMAAPTDGGGTVFCFGDVGRSETVARLRELAGVRGSMPADRAPVVVWRSTHPASSAGSREAWAAGLAAELGVERLGAEATGLVPARLAGASALVVLDDAPPDSRFTTAIGAYASAFDLSLVAPAGYFGRHASDRRFARTAFFAPDDLAGFRALAADRCAGSPGRRRSAAPDSARHDTDPRRVLDRMLAEVNWP